MLKLSAAFLLLLAPICAATAAIEFDPQFARFLYRLAATARANSTEDCLPNIFQNYTANEHVEVPCTTADEVVTCSGFSAASHDNKSIILGFRGTVGNKQWYDEILTSLRFPVSYAAGGNVDPYFYTSFLSIWNGGLKDQFLEFRREFPDYEVWVTGLSLGAAMASLAAGEVVHSKYVDPQNVKLVTYGQPRTGDILYSQVIDSLIPYRFRIVHDYDKVPHLPPLFFYFYQHHKAEVWYPNSMHDADDYHVVCDSIDESLRCSDGKVNLFNSNLHDHVTYYNVSFDEFAATGCIYPFD